MSARCIRPWWLRWLPRLFCRQPCVPAYHGWLCERCGAMFDD